MLTRVSDKSLRGVPEAEVVRRDLADEAVAFYRRLLAEREEDPALRIQLGRALQLVGEMHWDLGEFDRALAVHDEAVEVMEDLWEEHQLGTPPATSHSACARRACGRGSRGASRRASRWCGAPSTWASRSCVGRT